MSFDVFNVQGFICVFWSSFFGLLFFNSRSEVDLSERFWSFTLTHLLLLGIMCFAFPLRHCVEAVDPVGSAGLFLFGPQCGIMGHGPKHKPVLENELHALITLFIGTNCQAAK